MYSHPFRQNIKINGFGLGVTAGVPIKKINRGGNVYFAMPDLTEYKILLSNGNMTRCDATVYLDDIEVGTWRIEAFSTITIERPVGEARKFVLVQEGTNIAYQAGIGSYDTNGLLRAEFKPEMIRQRAPNRSRGIIRYDLPLTANMLRTNKVTSTITTQSKKQMTNNLRDNLQPAGTGLGNYSDQEFYDTDRLFTIDYNKITTINTRLVVDDSLYSQNKITRVSNYPQTGPQVNPYPSPPLQNPIPPRVDDSYYNYNASQNSNNYIPYDSTNYNNKYYYFDPTIGQYYTYPNRLAYQ